MSLKELERFRILNALINKEITQLRGAQMLNLSTRQVRNLICDLKNNGPKSLISKKRGVKSNRSYNPNFKKKILGIITEHYEDYGPTLIKEKLLDKHQNLQEILLLG